MSALEDAKAALARLEDPKHGGDWWGWDYAADLEVAIRPLVAEHERLTERLKEAYRVGADGWKHATEQAAEIADRLTTPPPDDEREALADLIGRGFSPRDGVATVFQAADRILAAGFRRQGPITDDTEWEWAVKTGSFGIIPAHSEGNARHKLNDLRYRTGQVVRRRKAGPWEPVEEGS